MTLEGLYTARYNNIYRGIKVPRTDNYSNMKKQHLQTIKLAYKLLLSTNKKSSSILIDLKQCIDQLQRQPKRQGPSLKSYLSQKEWTILTDSYFDLTRKETALLILSILKIKQLNQNEINGSITSIDFSVFGNFSTTNLWSALNKQTDHDISQMTKAVMLLITFCKESNS